MSADMVVERFNLMCRLVPADLCGSGAEKILNDDRFKFVRGLLALLIAGECFSGLLGIRLELARAVALNEDVSLADCKRAASFHNDNMGPTWGYGVISLS